MFKCSITLVIESLYKSDLSRVEMGQRRIGEEGRRLTEKWTKSLDR